MIKEGDPILTRGQQWRRHGVASVFPQDLGSQLLVVNVDAAQKDVSESRNGHWRALTFRHEQGPGSRRSRYSYLDFAAEHSRTAAPIENHCVTQLLPQVHNSTDRRFEHAGLIGKLPLLIAIAALSGPKELRDDIMKSCVLPKKWGKHPHTCGRGMCVNPSNNQFAK